MKTLSALPSTLGRDALRLTVLTAVRSNETRKATWAVFDLDKAGWSIPAARMKMKEPTSFRSPPLRSSCCARCTSVTSHYTARLSRRACCSASQVTSRSAI